MRMARIKLEGETAVYHCISRVVGGQRLLDSLCQEQLVEILGKLSAFCGVEILTDYRFCGYAAALVGASAIRKGLMSFLEPGEWAKAAAEYRRLLFVTGGSANRSDKRVLDPAAIKAVLERGGALGLGQVLRLRIRHFTDGVFLGSKEFVNEMFVRHRDRFGARRKDGARPIRGVPLPGVCVLRDLRVNAVG